MEKNKTRKRFKVSREEKIKWLCGGTVLQVKGTAQRSRGRSVSAVPEGQCL